MEDFVSVLATFTAGAGAGLMVARYARRHDTLDSDLRAARLMTWGVVAFYLAGAFYGIVGHWGPAVLWVVIASLILGTDILRDRIGDRRVRAAERQRGIE